MSMSNVMLKMTFHCPSGRLPCQARDGQSPHEVMSTSAHTSQVSQSTSFLKGVQVIVHISSHVTNHEVHIIFKGGPSHSPRKQRNKCRHGRCGSARPKICLRGGYVLSTSKKMGTSSIDDKFIVDNLFLVTSSLDWYAGIVEFLTTQRLPSEWTKE